jgi:two-component system, LuxR family, sensor kinase FixL
MSSYVERSQGEIEIVLLVDDNPVNLQILYKTLQGCGYELLIAKDGETALDIAQKVKPSLILLDIIMPGMNGYEVCEALKQNPETEEIAVIFLSALEDSSAKVKGFSVGGVDYVSKPFQADEVVARVRNHIKIHRLESQLARRNVELESENQQILNSISEGIIGLDRKGRVSMLNPAATIITGWSAADCLGEQLTGLGLFDSDDHYRIPEHQTLPYRSYRMGQSGFSDMEMIKRRDNTLVPVALSSTPRAEGGAVVVFRDISEWVESEEALRLAREEMESQRQHLAHMERLSTTGEMAAGIAHEVNQPLTAISNYSRVAKRLLEDAPIEKQAVSELLDKLNMQAVRASDVIKRMRGFVKKPDDAVTTIDANTVIQEVIALAEVDSRINDVSVHFEPQPDMPLLVIDVVQIEQVTLNLIRNAMESMVEANNRQQGVLVTTELEQGYIVFQVIDYGVGVAEEAGPHLFAPFYTTKSSGMGIGLSICQSIVLAHGGKIGFYNNDNGGATFYFSLPYK